MGKTLKELLESFDFNRAALAKQRLQNVRHLGRKVRGARIANLMRAAGLKEEEVEETDLDQLDEVLSADASAEEWISDFVHSDDPKFAGKSKKERIKMALGAYYAKSRSKDGEGLSEENKEKKEKKEDLPFDPDPPKKNQSATAGKYGQGYSTARHLARQGMKQAMKEEYDVEISDEVADQILEAAKQYAGLEKEDKPGKIKTAVIKSHEKAVESETVEGWKDPKKPVKESYDEEGNLITMPKTYKEFMLEYEVGPGGKYVHKGTYGSAKGAKFGNTDYDKETLDTKDDEGGEVQQKRGRGRPAGAKSGARGPRIK